jgi:hypothetical protein
MAIFGKKGTKMEKQKIDFSPRAIEARIIMRDGWRTLEDDQLDAGIAALIVAGVPKKDAVKPSFTRRLGISKDGAFVVAVESPVTDVGGRYHPDMGAPQFITIGLPLQYAIELLGSTFSPEIELSARRKRFDEYQKAQTAKQAAEADKLRKIDADRAAEEKVRQACRAGDWSLLDKLARFAARLAVVVEARDSALATDLRKLVADSLTGVDDDPASWPRTPSWFVGIGLENLSDERRQALLLGSQGQREIAQIEMIPPGKRPALAAMAGNDRAAMLAHWGQIVAANRRHAAAPRPSRDLGE